MPVIRGAFTLVELLIVVSIVAVLTVIAVPNFLEAEARTNVSRVKTDLQTLATAIESYTADHGHVPREQNSTWYGSGDQLPNQYGVFVHVSAIMSNVLSTPVPYLSKARMPEAFRSPFSPVDEQYYTYHDLGTRRERNPFSMFWSEADSYYGPWRLLSIGPDQRYTHGFSNSTQLAYDPTNGTYSTGNIFRSPLFPDSVQPPIGVLLGAH